MQIEAVCFIFRFRVSRQSHVMQFRTTDNLQITSIPSKIRSLHQQEGRNNKFSERIPLNSYISFHRRTLSKKNSSTGCHRFSLNSFIAWKQMCLLTLSDWDGKDKGVCVHWRQFASNTESFHFIIIEGTRLKTQKAPLLSFLHYKILLVIK